MRKKRKEIAEQYLKAIDFNRQVMKYMSV